MGYQYLKSKIENQINLARSLVIDSVEPEFSDNPTTWRYVRGRLLKILGDSGLAGKVAEIFSEFEKKGGDHE